MRVILNPKSGRGNGARLKSLLQRELARAGLDFELLETSGMGSAAQLAREGLEKGETRIVAVGGDGTVGEISNILVGTGRELGIVAVGTGNDLARSLGLPRNRVREAVAVLRDGTVRSIDVGSDSGKHFTSVMGLGFPADVADQANRYRRLKGKLAFSVAVYSRIRSMSAVPVEVELDGKTFPMNCTSALVLNTPFTGGGLHLAPSASLSDGFLDAVLVDDIGRLQLLLNFPRVFKGSHLSNPHFHSYRCRTFRLRTAKPLLKTLDGDIFGTQPADVKVLPAALQVIT